ncbi:MAG: CAP domain-containing protein [Bacteroidales bacterium]|nr:CAP domain-containing protein [Bacteroidales bacterium]
MKLRIIILSFLFVFAGFSCLAEENDPETEQNNQETEQKDEPVTNSSAFTDDEIKAANTAADVSYLSDDEKEVILLCNLARLDGSRFAEAYVKPHLNGKTSSAIQSLYSDLSAVKNLPMYQPKKELCESAAYHAEDMGSSGRTGHTSTDGTSMGDRVWGYAPEAGAIAENCSYGYSEPLAIVIQLLVDEGLTPPGHRNSILSTKYNFIGVAIREHKSWRYNCVQDFSAN